MSCSIGPLTGLSPAALQTMLTNAQTAYAQLMSGAKVVTASYAQGDGNRSVTYTQANVANLTMFIAQLQQALGLRARVRSPARFRFR